MKDLFIDMEKISQILVKTKQLYNDTHNKIPFQLQATGYKMDFSWLRTAGCPDPCLTQPNSHGAG